MSEKLAGLRCKHPKDFWNLLKGFDSNKIDDINMEEWHMHFSHLFVHNESEGNSDNFISEKKVEEWDKDFSLNIRVEESYVFI